MHLIITLYTNRHPLHLWRLLYVISTNSGYGMESRHDYHFENILVLVEYVELQMLFYYSTMPYVKGNQYI